MGIFLFILGNLFLVVLIYKTFCKPKPKPQFPYLELMGLTLKEAKKMYDFGEKFPFDKLSFEKGVINGFSFPYSHYYDYNKYYGILDEFAKRYKIKIVEDPNDCYYPVRQYEFSYKVVDFNPPTKECGLHKANIHVSKTIERACDVLLRQVLEKMAYNNKVEEYKKRTKGL